MTSHQLDEERIFHLAREIPRAEARSEYLEQVCAGDQALRDRVESLLEIHEDEQSFLKSAENQVAPTVDLGQPLERRGISIGRYKLMEQIGEGGMGTVFVAQQERPIRRKVAVKVIKPGMDSKAVVARFEAERQALAMMDHPSIAKVLDAGTTESGRPYFAMEYVKGVTITEYCDRNRLMIPERLELFIQVCQAIQHAHQKGIIHRDIKPSNVLVTLHDGKPVPKVIDFGVAKALNARLTDKTIYTEHLQVIGTLLYMSPEQAELSGLDIDTRSDVFSLGVLLYELLTGTTPFQKDELNKAGFDEQRRIIRDQEPPRASARISSLGDTLTAIADKRSTDGKKLHSTVRGELDWVILKSMEKDRTRRYETANAFARDIERYLAKDPTEAHPPSLGYRLRKLAAKNRVAIAVASLFIIAAMSFGFQQWRLMSRLKITSATYHEELFQGALIAAMSNHPRFQELMDSVDPEWIQSGQARVALLKGLHLMYRGEPDGAAELFGQALEIDEHNVAAHAALNLANLHRGKFDDWMETSIPIANMEPQSPEGFLLKAQAISAVGDPEEALRLADRALHLRHSSLALASRAEIRAWLALEHNDFTELTESIQEIRALRRTLPNESAFVLNADLLIHLGALILSDPTRYDEFATEAMVPAQKLIEHFPNYEFGRYHRANLFSILGKHDKAEQEWRELVQLKRRPNWVIDFAQILYRNGKYEEAKYELGKSDAPQYTSFGAYILSERPEDLSSVRQHVLVSEARYMEEFKLRSLTLIGEQDRATDLARTYLSSLSERTGSWYEWQRAKLDAYARKDFSEAELLANAGKSLFKRCDAYCLLGVVALARGKRNDAEAFFQKSIDTRAVWFESYQMADAILQRLKKDDSWPFWLASADDSGAKLKHRGTRENDH